jgi:hypothetical protein
VVPDVVATKEEEEVANEEVANEEVVDEDVVATKEEEEVMVFVMTNDVGLR